MHRIRAPVSLLYSPRSSPLPTSHLHNGFVVWLTQRARAGAILRKQSSLATEQMAAPGKSEHSPQIRMKEPRRWTKRLCPRNRSCKGRTQQRSLLRNWESAHKAQSSRPLHPRQMTSQRGLVRYDFLAPNSFSFPSRSTQVGLRVGTKEGVRNTFNYLRLGLCSEVITYNFNYLRVTGKEMSLLKCSLGIKERPTLKRQLQDL